MGKQDEDDLEPCSLKTFQKRLAPWLEVLGWECPVCEGDGKIWPDEEESEEDEEGENDGIDEELEHSQDKPEPIICPRCAGTGKIREKVSTDKAA